MIRIANLTKTFRLRGEIKTVIDDLTLTIPSGRAVALLGRNGAGKSTLLEMISGTQRPDSGTIDSDGSISWAVGLSSSFHRELTGAQNVRFIARIYGVDTDDLATFVQDFSELGRQFHMPVRSYSQGMRARLGFGCAMGIHFDTYLVDEVTAVGDAAFKRKSRAVFRQRMKTSGALLVSHSLTQVREFCDAGLVLEDGRAHYFDNLEEAIALHEDILS
jgi:capsular polysaccharide transport system ATP-binding protein